jgi:hypothetical protein
MVRAGAARKRWGCCEARRLAEFGELPLTHPEGIRLGELHAAVVEERPEALLDAGRPELVVPEVEAFVAEHPLREGARATFMLRRSSGSEPSPALHHGVARRLNAWFFTAFAGYLNQHQQRLQAIRVRQPPTRANRSGARRRSGRVPSRPGHRATSVDECWSRSCSPPCRTPAPGSRWDAYGPPSPTTRRGGRRRLASRRRRQPR